MKSTLEDLIAGAPAHLKMAEMQEEQRLGRQESELADKETKTFQTRIHTALGSQVMARLGTVSYGEDSGLRAMRFQADGRSFILRQAIGSVVNLIAGNREIFQFNLSNPEAKDRFLEALGDALASTA